jgi:hypothetical protein
LYNNKIPFSLINVFLSVFLLISECRLADIATNGLGPCKSATDAHHGTLEIKLQAANQVAVVGITASSSVNTRIRLICTDLTAVAVFTVISLEKNYS